MEEKTEKEKTFNIITHINELMFQSQVTQYFKNTKETPIELELIIPNLIDCNITKFEIIKNNQKIVSKLLEKEKAKEKYVDSLTDGNSGFLSYNEEDEIKTYLGNISSGEEIELKTFFFGHIINRDLSYQATFPVIFPNFIMNVPNSDKGSEEYNYYKQIVEGKIYINTRSKLTRLVIKGSNNFDKIEKKIGENKKSAEIEFSKNNFDNKDIPGIILFRTEKINDEVLYFQSDPRRKKSYYMLQKTLIMPEFSKEFKDEIDEDGHLNYMSLLKNKEKEEKEEKKISKACYIFLLDQSGSMSGDSIKLSCKSLLLFLQSLNEKCYFQLIGFGSDFEKYNINPVIYNKENVNYISNIINGLNADKGGTNISQPLKDIFTSNSYSNINLSKNIFMLTDGEVHDREECIRLVTDNNGKFRLHAIGIGNDFDKILIEECGKLGKGSSSFVQDMDNINSVVIYNLNRSLRPYITEMKFNFLNYKNEINSSIITCTPKDNFTYQNEIANYSFILPGDKNLSNLNLKITGKDPINPIEGSIIFSNNIIKLKNGEEMSKMIVGKALKDNQDLIQNEKKEIEFAKKYQILSKNTALFAEIINPQKQESELIKVNLEISQKKKESPFPVYSYFSGMGNPIMKTNINFGYMNNFQQPNYIFGSNPYGNFNMNMQFNQMNNNYMINQPQMTFNSMSSNRGNEILDDDEEPEYMILQRD